MSFDVFVDAYKAGESAPYPISVLEEAFGPFIQFKDEDCWEVAFPGGGGATVFVRDERMVSQFSLNRPGRDLRLWDTLVEIMRRTGSVCYWPGVDRTVVADLALVSELPEDLVGGLGEPIEVKDGSALLAQIES